MARARQIAIITGLTIGVIGFLFGWREAAKRTTAEGLLNDALHREIQRARDTPAQDQVPSNPETTHASTTATTIDDAAVLKRLQQDLARQRAKEATAGAAAQQQFMAARETQEEIARQFRANVRLRYGAFFTEHSLSDAKISAFEDAMMEKFWTMSDLLIATRGAGMSDQDTLELRRQQLGAIDDKIRMAVGESVFQDYQRYDLSASARGLVETLAGKIFYKDPLSSTQGAQLAEMITANVTGARRTDEWLRRQTFAGGSADPSWSDVDWETVVSNVRNVLSASQLSTLRTLVADARLHREIEQRLRDADQRGRDTVRGGKQ